MEAMVFSDSCALRICGLLVILVVTVVGVEQVLELAYFVAYMHRLDVRISQLSMLKLLLQVLEFLAGLVVERVKKLLQPFLLPRVRHV